MFDSIGFIGAGRIARVMLGGWLRGNTLPPRILIFDQNPAVLEALQRDFPQIVVATLQECAACELVLGALHPPALLEALPAIGAVLDKNALFLSLAPKIKLASLQEKLGGFEQLARMNPNAPSIIGQGFNPVAFACCLPLAQRARLLLLLEALGQSPEVDENLLEAYAVISAMGPTYFGFQFDKVRELAETFGLEKTAAHAALRAMLHGTVDLLFASNIPTSTALDLVPVRPMADDETAIQQMLQTRLSAIHTKLTS